MEKYNDGDIIYGQGNFIFDGDDNEYWNSSLLLEIDDKKMKIDYIPIEKDNSLIKISDNTQIIENFLIRSEQIKETNFIENEYNKFSKEHLDGYLNIMNKTRFYKKY